jgi:hypothetical protein
MHARHILSTLALVIVGTLPACYEPTFRNCIIACGPKDECPSGLSCSAGFCTSGPQCKTDGSPAGDTSDLGADDSTRDAVSDTDAEDRPDTFPDAGRDGDASETSTVDGVEAAPDAPEIDAGVDATDAASDGDGPPPDAFAGDADAPSPDGDTADMGASTDRPPEVVPTCPPGIRVIARTGKCAPMNDLNGDGLADGLADFQHEFDALISDGAHFGRVDRWLGGGPWYSGVPSVHGVLTGDVNGDRITDIVTFGPAVVTVLVLPGTGTGIIDDFAANWSAVALHGQYFTYLADVSGDGKDDIIALNQGKVDVALSTGFNFGAQTTWATSDLSGYNGAYFADVDGDYCADAITVGATTVDVRLSTRTSFKAPSAWLSVNVVEGDIIHFADADGDGRADYIRVRPEETSVALSDGRTFGALETWFTGPLAGSSKTFFVDVDGDGRADIVAINDASVEVALSVGTMFAAPTVWYSGSFAGTYWTNFAFEPAGDHPEP